MVKAEPISASLTLSMNNPNCNNVVGAGIIEIRNNEMITRLSKTAISFPRFFLLLIKKYRTELSKEKKTIDQNKWYMLAARDNMPANGSISKTLFLLTPPNITSWIPRNTSGCKAYARRGPVSPPINRDVATGFRAYNKLAIELSKYFASKILLKDIKNVKKLIGKIDK